MQRWQIQKLILKKNKKTKQIEINIDYEVAEHWDLIYFFVIKAEKLCKFYTLEEQGEETAHRLQYYHIKGIRMSAEQGDDAFTFHYQKGPIHKLVINTPKIRQKDHKLKCIDDKLVRASNGIPLSDLLRNETGKSKH